MQTHPGINLLNTWTLESDILGLIPSYAIS